MTGNFQEVTETVSEHVVNRQRVGRQPENEVIFVGCFTVYAYIVYQLLVVGLIVNATSTRLYLLARGLATPC